MKVNEFIKWADAVKAKYGNLFRNGLRIKPFPHEVYGWKEMAVDREGNLMFFAGDHGSSNPEHVISVVDGVCYSTEHSNGRFQQACRTIYEGRDTAEVIVKVAYGKKVLAKKHDIACLTESVKVETDNKIAMAAKEQKVENRDADKQAADLSKAKKDILSTRGLMKILERIHSDWFYWVRRIAHDEDKDKNYTYVCQCGCWGRGWHTTYDETDLGCSYKRQCKSDQKPKGTKVSKKTFYKYLKEYLKNLVDDPSVDRDSFCMDAFGYGEFTLVYDSKEGKEKYFADLSVVQKFPADYPFRGVSWRDGLRQATEDEIKSTKTWVKVYGSGHALDVAMVNWKKKIWRHLTAAEMAA